MAAALSCGPGTDRETRSGIYVWGHEVSAITLCDDAAATYWVSGDTVPLREAYEAFRFEEPYTEVFVRVNAPLRREGRPVAPSEAVAVGGAAVADWRQGPHLGGVFLPLYH